MINTLNLFIKKPDKIFHISDVHIRLSERHEEYREVFKKLYDVIKTNKSDNSLIVLTGDVFHSKVDLSPESVSLASDFFVNLCELCPLIIIAGNHDAQINNLKRMDSITPIIDAINHENIFYLKNNGLYSAGDILFNVFSVFAKPEDYITKYTDFALNSFRKRVVLYHGQIDGAVTETGFLIRDSLVKKDMFNGSDLVLLGDIHKRQIIQKENRVLGKPIIYYAGSLIQQNFGESIEDHGVTVWDIDTNSYNFIPIENDYGYVTLQFFDKKFQINCSKLPKNTRLRIICDSLSKVELREIIALFKNECNLLDCIVLNKEQKNTKSFLEVVHNDISKDTGLNSILSGILKWDILSIEKLINNYCELSKVVFTNDNEKNRFYEYNRKFFDSIKTEGNCFNPHSIKWEPLNFKWSNMFSYGENNEIDFTKLSGVVGIFGSNASGKSNIVSSMCYCLFDKWDRGYKNFHVKNSLKDEFNCSFSFKIGDSFYRIEKTGRSQKTNSVKVDMDVYKVFENGNEVRLTDISRSKTEGILEGLIGSYQDFLFTTLYSQNSGKNIFDFIDMTNTDRKQFLFNVFKLGVFDLLNEKASTLLKDIRREIDFLIQDENPSVELKKIEKDLNEKKFIKEQLLKSKDSLISLLQELKEKKQNLEEKISRYYFKKPISDNAYEESNFIRPVLLNLIFQNEAKLDQINTEINNIKLKLDSIYENLKSIDEKDFEEKRQEYDKLIQIHSEKIVRKEKILYSIEQKRKKAEMLSKYEYNPNCPFCLKNPFVVDAKKTAEELEKDTKLLQELQEEILILEGRIKNLEYVKKTKDLMESSFKLIKEYNDNIKKLELQKSELIGEIDLNKEKLKKVETLISEYLDNKECFIEYQKLDALLKEQNSNILSKEKELLALSEKIGQLDVRIENDLCKIKSLNEKIEKLNKLEEDRLVLEKYAKVTGSNGISYFILKNFLNVLEENVNFVLGQFEKFTVKIDFDDKSIIPLIKYSDEMIWPIEMASGFERFIISISFKIAFSILMKNSVPSFLIIDEGFGSLDSSNFLKLKNFFEFLKKHYKFILVISHLDKVRDVVDQRIDVIKDDLFSKVIV